MGNGSMAAAAFRTAVLALACAACTSIAVDERTFEGTSWRVTAIDGRATPANGEYRMEFKGGQISGRFGCNGWGGSYAVTGATLTASQVRSTLMACPEPGMSLESQGLAVLLQPMRATESGNATLMLSNSAGSIELKRTP